MVNKLDSGANSHSILQSSGGSCGPQNLSCKMPSSHFSRISSATQFSNSKERKSKRKRVFHLFRYLAGSSSTPCTERTNAKRAHQISPWHPARMLNVAVLDAHLAFPAKLRLSSHSKWRLCFSRSSFTPSVSCSPQRGSEYLRFGRLASQTLPLQANAPAPMGSVEQSRLETSCRFDRVRTSTHRSTALSIAKGMCTARN